MIHPSVQQAFIDLTVSVEGRTNWLYLDTKCLVTTGIGNLVDPIEAALVLPFAHPDGSRATRDEIAAAWEIVKARKDLARMGGGAFAALTSIRLAPADVDVLVQGRRVANQQLLVHAWPNFPHWPADAQLGAHSMAWAAGGGFSAEFPHFTAAARAGDWLTCAGPPGDADQDPSKRGEAWLEDNHKPGPNPANPGLHKRNLANKRLFENAAAVVALGADPTVLYWPGSPAAA